MIFYILRSSFSARPTRFVKKKRISFVNTNKNKQILPGMVLQSDQLSTAVDNARQVLQLPRVSGADQRHSTSSSKAASSSSSRRLGDADRNRRRQRASARLLSYFVVRGGRGGGRKMRVGAKGTKEVVLGLGADMIVMRAEAGKRIESAANILVGRR